MFSTLLDLVANRFDITKGWASENLKRHCEVDDMGTVNLKICLLLDINISYS